MRQLAAALLALVVIASACGAQGDEPGTAQESESTPTTEAGAGPDADFGDLKAPCGPGELTVDPSEAGRGTDKLYIGVGNDRTSDIRPGLQATIWDSSLAFVEWCNAQGGIGGLEIEVVDLAEVALPLLDEPNHPRFGDYVHQHTKDWSASVSRADAFVFVVPEYNHSFNGATKNALDFLHNEWRDKAVGTVTYGGVSGGLRAVQVTKLTLTGLRMMPIVEAVTIPMVSQHVKDGAFEPNDLHIKSAEALLVELKRWAEALKPLRG